MVYETFVGVRMSTSPATSTIWIRDGASLVLLAARAGDARFSSGRRCRRPPSDIEGDVDLGEPSWRRCWRCCRRCRRDAGEASVRTASVAIRADRRGRRRRRQEGLHWPANTPISGHPGDPSTCPDAAGERSGVDADVDSHVDVGEVRDGGRRRARRGGRCRCRRRRRGGGRGGSGGGGGRRGRGGRGRAPPRRGGRCRGGALRLRSARGVRCSTRSRASPTIFGRRRRWSSRWRALGAPLSCCSRSGVGLGRPLEITECRPSWIVPFSPGRIGS